MLCEIASAAAAAEVAIIEGRGDVLAESELVCDLTKAGFSECERFKCIFDKCGEEAFCEFEEACRCFRLVSKSVRVNS